MNRKILSGAAGALAFVALSSAAQALDFNFSFDNVTGNINGTVKGELIGLADNAWSFPTDIIITSVPAGMELPGTPFTVSNWLTVLPPGAFVRNGGDFYVTNGQLTTFGSLQIYGGFLDLNWSGTYDVLSDGSNVVWNETGASGITTSAVVAAPEPASWAMILIGFLGVAGLAGYRRAKTVPSVA